jgi:hypothetical protein
MKLYTTGSTVLYNQDGSFLAVILPTQVMADNANTTKVIFADGKEIKFKGFTIIEITNLVQSGGIKVANSTLDD